MPIVINEIEIAMEVVPARPAQGHSVAAADARQREDLIRECVEKVMELINQKNER